MTPPVGSRVCVDSAISFVVVEAVGVVRVGADVLAVLVPLKLNEMVRCAQTRIRAGLHNP